MKLKTEKRWELPDHCQIKHQCRHPSLTRNSSLKKLPIKKELISFSMAILMALLCCITVQAEEYPEPYAYSNEVAIPSRKQPTDYSCWAASGGSVATYLGGKNVSTYEFANAVGISTDNKNGAQPQQVVAGFEKLGYSPIFVDYPLSFGSVSNIIYYNSQPVYLQLIHHAAVLYGYTTGGIQKVGIMDPADGSFNYVDYFNLADPNGSGVSLNGSYQRWHRSIYNF